MNEINQSPILTPSGRPVLSVPAYHTRPLIASQAAEDEAEGLKAKIYLMKGAPVLLTRNIWTAHGLTKGTIGKSV